MAACAGFVDIQIHGIAGVDFTDEDLTLEYRSPRSQETRVCAGIKLSYDGIGRRVRPPTLIVAPERRSGKLSLRNACAGAENVNRSTSRQTA